MIVRDPSMSDGDRTKANGEHHDAAGAPSSTALRPRSEESSAVAGRRDAEEAAYLRELRDNEIRWEGYLD